MKQTHFPHKDIETKWQSLWDAVKLNQPVITEVKKPFYNLMMFPYPSAEGLHVGNMYAFTGSDIYGRFKRMEGHDVFEPIGLDGFGIHSENYALRIGRHPMDHAEITQKNYYEQLHKIGAMFDWSRTVETYDTDYYRWTQWLFVQMFRRGLAYRSKAEVNWCPSCKTVLADEQVIDGKCERCGNTVENRLLEQWFFRITAYAEKLLENTFSLDWSEKVKTAQKNWIGKKEGINISYKVFDVKNTTIGEIACFTTRPDTNFGATFVVIAPDHPFVSQIMEVIKKDQRIAITKYIAETKRKSDTDRNAEGRKKTGVFTGLYCFNELNNTRMPLYISDFVLLSFGTGAVVGVPGHDLRDFEFAKEFDLPIRRVVKGPDGDMSPITRQEQVQEDEGSMVDSGFLSGMDIHDAIAAMMDYLEKKGWGKRVTTYHLRDWLISRQRYWGPPIPMIRCETCGAQNKGERQDMPGWWTVPDDQLPVILPRIRDYKPGDDGIAPLAKHKEFYEVTCPGCRGKAKRETDVSDTFLDSSWYFLRYPSVNLMVDGRNSMIEAEAGTSRVENQTSNIQPQNPASSIQHLTSNLPWDPAITKKWLPVDMYTGGAEHSVLHLMYSRFVTMALHDWGYVDFDEPFAKFYAHGLVIKDGVKMSKSKGNVVNPDDYIALYGADALRLYLMFMGPFDQGGDFRDSAMEGMSRWVGRIWRLGSQVEKKKIDSSDTVKSSLQKLIKNVSDDLEKRRYNTAIAHMMEFTNLVAGETGAIGKADFLIFLLLLAPFAPHVAEELYQRFKGRTADDFTANDSVHKQPWPVCDESAIAVEGVAFVVQVNGKVRDTLSVSAAQSKNQKEMESQSRASQRVNNHIGDKKIMKIIFVPGKLLNFVVPV